MTNELISIVLPCYRAERFLSRIIEDVLAQTYQAWELLIVSNGEGQEPQLAIARQYAAKHTNIRVLTSVKGGVSLARNLGMKEAQGKWLAFVDADDRITPDHLEIYMNAVAQAPVPPDMVFGGFDKPIPHGTTLNDLIIDDKQNILSPPWNKLYRAEFVHGHQFNTRITMFEDALFNNELLTRTTNVLLIPMTGYRNLPVQGSATSRYHATLEEGWDACTQCRRVLLKRAGWTNEHITEREIADRFIRVYDVLGNTFKQDAPFTLCQKHQEVKRIVFQDQQLAKSMRQHRLSDQRLMFKLYKLCYLSRSTWLMTLFMTLRQRLK